MTIQMNRRLLYIPVFHIDTNLINARQKLSAVNQLEKWFEDEVILINMSNTAHSEAKAGGNIQRTHKANHQIYTTNPSAGTADPLYRKIEAVIFPGGTRDDNQRNDVKIIFDAAKYAAILVTEDGGIIGNRDKLRADVKILSLKEAVIFIREKIQERDEFNKRVSKEIGGQLPVWTDLD
jgi:hypothetical protein